MKFKLISAYLVIFFLALSVQSGRNVNSRKIPAENDFLSEGGGPRYANQESLNVELANILSSTKDRDAIDVDMVIGDSISTVTSIVSGSGGVDIDTIIECDLITGGPNVDTILSCEVITGALDIEDSVAIGSGDFITTVAVSKDSIQFVIGDSTYSIAVTNTYVTP